MGAGADPRRNGDDYPMTSLSDGLGPQKDPNSGRTRVESGPAGTHRPTTRRGSAIGPAGPVAQSAHRIEGEADPLLVVTDGGEAQAGDVDVGPSHRRRGHRR